MSLNQSVSGGAPWWQSRGLWAAAVALVPFLFYIRSAGFDFVYDDKILVANNHLIRSLWNIPSFFFLDVNGLLHNGASSYYRPVAYAFYAAVQFVFGQGSAGFHISNVVLHSLNTVVVFLLADVFFSNHFAYMERSRIAAAGCAMFFAVNPLNTEAVYWISSSQELLWAFFGLLALYVSVVDEGSEVSRLTRLYAALFFAALLCKETAAALLPLIFAYDAIFRGRDFWKNVAPVKYSYMAVAIGAYLLLRVNALGGFAPTRASGFFFSYDGILNAFFVFGRYVSKLFSPFSLNHWYAPAQGMSWIWLVCSGIFLAAALFFAVKKRHFFFFVLLFVALPLLPVLSPKALSSNVVFAERYLYFPSAGFAIFIFAAMIVCRKKIGTAGVVTYRAAVFFTAVFLLLCAVFLADRGKAWKDEYAYWNSAIAGTEDKCRPYVFLGMTYLQDKNVPEAAKVFKEAVNAMPDCAYAYDYLGIISYNNGDVAAAGEMFGRAVAVDSKLHAAYYHLGLVNIALGNRDGAIEALKKSLSISNEDVRIRSAMHTAVLMPKSRARRK